MNKKYLYRVHEGEIIKYEIVDEDDFEITITSDFIDWNFRVSKLDSLYFRTYEDVKESLLKSPRERLAKALIEMRNVLNEITEIESLTEN